MITITTKSTSNITQLTGGFTYSTQNGQFIYEFFNGEEWVRIERPVAEFNIFDSEFYLNSNPDVASQTQITQTTNNSTQTIINNSMINGNRIDSLLHYVEFGAQQGRDPSPLFDSQYYLEQNPDVATALAGGDFSGDPLLHYVKSGAQEGRDPNPFFDSDYYLTTYTDVADEGMNPLEHYVLFGAAEGRD
ncbi:MAG: hypothetical protein QNJ53_17180, partial [Pleurocapsa sp. MO_192.B19]|nr:hypothetical protein [Pleurocapsa sp. MO_192.B19]